MLVLFRSLVGAACLAAATMAGAQSVTWRPIDGPVGDVVGFGAGRARTLVLPEAVTHLEDGATSWTRVAGTGLLRNWNHVYSAAAVDGDLLLVGVRYGGGVYESQDWGTSFTKVPSMNTLVGAARTDAGLCAATDLQVFCRSDEGEWTLHSQPPGEVTALGLGPDGGLLAGTSIGIAEWSETAAAWTRTGPRTRIDEWATDEAGGLYVATSSGAYHRNAAGGWRSLEGASYIDPDTGRRITNITAVAALPSGTVLAGNYRRLVRSTDDGATWQVVYGSAVQGLSVDDDGTVYAAAGGRGVVVSRDDGQTWTPVNTGLSTSQVDAMAPWEAGRFVVASRTAGLVEVDGAAAAPDWRSLGRFDGATVQSTFVRGDTLIHGGYGPSAATSFDAGATWEAARMRLSDGSETTSFGTIRDIVERRDTLFAAASGGVIHSPDGRQWTYYEPILYPRPASLHAAGDALIAVGYEGGVWHQDGPGKPWVQRPAPAAQPLWTFADDGEGRWYMGTSEGVFTSQNAGQSWSRLGTLREAIWMAGVGPRGWVWVGVDGQGVLVWTGVNPDWTPVGGPDGVLSWHITRDVVYAGTESAWIYQGIIDAPTNADSPGDVPRTTTLDAYPNPFHDAVTLSFELDRPDVVDLHIFDVRGAEVQRAAVGSLPAGRHSVEVGHGLPSGVYFCRLRTSVGTETRVVVRVR